MTTKYNTEYPDIGLREYLTSMVGKIFKILPIYEKNPHDALLYVDGFLRELNGFRELIDAVGDDPEFLSMLSTLCGIQQSVACDSFSKSDVFKAINQCDSVRHKYAGIGETEVQS